MSVIITALLILVSVASLQTAQFSYAEDFPCLKVHFIDVGQGDSCVIEFPDGRNMIIDAGDNKKEVKSKLKSYIDNNIRKNDEGKVVFDYAIMTHSDSDHIGSFDTIYDNYVVKTTYRPNQKATYKDYVDPASEANGDGGFWGENLGEKSTLTYKKMIASAYEKSENVIVTNPYSDTQNCIKYIGENIYKQFEFNFYSPINSYYNDNNNYSSVMVLSYQNKNIVLTGDAEKENEKEFVNAANEGLGRYEIFKNFGADVIKLGHHGSRTSTSADYLKIVTKNSDCSKVFAIVSAGIGNKYGHPHEETIDRLKEFGFSEDRILYTEKTVKDASGNDVEVKQDIVITVENDGSGYILKYGSMQGGSGSGSGGNSGSGSGGSSGSGSGGNSGSGSGGSSGSNNSIISEAAEWFGRQDATTKIIVIVVIVVVMLLMIVALTKMSKRKRKKVVKKTVKSINKNNTKNKKGK